MTGHRFSSRTFSSLSATPQAGRPCCALIISSASSAAMPGTPFTCRVTSRESPFVYNHVVVL